MTKSNGIDVSKWQGDIDWAAVKESGVKFAILRAGYGRETSQKDEFFEKNYEGCKKNGIPCGAYWYSYAMSADDARKEAKACIETIKGKQFEFPIYFDIEEKKQLDLGKEACTAIAKAFLDELESAGYWAGLYMSKSHLENRISAAVRERYAVWVAHYGVSKTDYNGTFGMWQKSSEGKVKGISGNVDLDECYIDYPSEVKKAGLNGYKKTVSDKKAASCKPSTPAFTSYTVKRGDSLWAIAQKYLGDGNRYKEIMYETGLTSTTIYPKQVLRIPKK